jgi:hypothetical protein
LVSVAAISGCLFLAFCATEPPSRNQLPVRSFILSGAPYFSMGQRLTKDS